MNQPLPSYPDYKPAGLPWLAEVPAHWKIKRNKYLFRERDARSLTGEEELLTVSQYTGITKRADRRKHAEELLTTAASLVGYKMVDQDDLVINIMLAWNGSLGISDYNGIVSPAYCVYRPTSVNDPRYFHYLFRSPLYKGMYKAVSTGVVDSRLRLYSDKFFALPALLPPLPEQQRIVAFLDGKTRQIARLLRNEQKQALIHRAVTQGLDADAPRKESGVAWLGEVPAHWEVKALKTVLKQTDYGTSESLSDEGSVSVLTMGHIQDGKVLIPSKGSLNHVPEGLNLEKHDLLFNRTNSPELVGKVGLFDNESIQNITFASYLVRLRVSSEHSAYWLNYLLNSTNFWAYARSQAFVSLHQANLNPTRYRQMLIPVPPPFEQKLIVDHLLQTSNNIDQTIARAHREIELIQEYRTRLIGDVVTGRVDVRHLADAASGLELPAEDELDLEDEEAEEETVLETEDGRD
jgi:type I restriction enzyme S subunit